jgi:glycosyltransferase involved in cell wall biosynthesis
MEAGVSVIICCHNSVNRLPKVFESLEKQKDLNDIKWEILIIDNSSTDNTFDYVNVYAKAHDLPIQVLSEPKMGLSYARKTGIDFASYEFICYIDDDNWVNENYISTIYRIMLNNPEIGLCGGQGIPAFESTPPWWFESFQGAFAVGPQGYNQSGFIMELPGHLYGAGMTLRKSAWLQLLHHGFSYKLTGRQGITLSSGEDSELSFALQLAGYRLWYEPTLTFYHFMPEGRLNETYLRNLFIAFGKSDVVLTIYQSQFSSFGRIKKFFVQNYLLCLFYNLYALIRLYLTSITGKRDPDSRMQLKLNLLRSLSKSAEHLTMFGGYAALCRSISLPIPVSPSK